MEMWLTLLLLTALVISDQRFVILDGLQKTVEVPFGSSVIFECGLKIKTNGRFWVKWSFNSSGSSFPGSELFCDEIINKSAKLTTVVSNQTTQDPRNKEQQLCIKSNVTDQNNGWYFCEVKIDIPTLTSNHSNGTKLIISQSKEHATHPSLPLVTVKQATVSPTDTFSLDGHWMWILLGVSSFILIVLLVLCVLLRRRLRRSRV
ncbi:uncharacterized protein LOC117951029 isoform X3 [Etheostoma cragini]|uniref:uncharacterized protein LOC117951029 isoform X3 n=1 Tax=Etheostoma cragini TaxID=417921 RepID=UPI00155EF883|nr:uncharacterized protein LOC117951029 isoform X3 [Etheostoma cragini]